VTQSSTKFWIHLNFNLPTMNTLIDDLVKMSVNMQTTNEPFLKHLNVRKTPHVVVTAEDDDFDVEIIKQLQGEGFNVQYVAMGEETGNRYAQRLHDIANHMTGVNEYYAIVGKAQCLVDSSCMTKYSFRRCSRSCIGNTYQSIT
jgi:hypothetical protein